MKTPSIPPSFWKALAVAILAVAASVGLPISSAQSAAIMKIAETLPVAIVAGGTILHAVRAIFASNVLKAKEVQAIADARVAEAKAAEQHTAEAAKAA